MINVAVIPIDNRPICYDLIDDILAIDKSINLYLPDIKLLGSLNNSSDIDRVFGFLENLSDIDYLIVSLDTIAYGGLITSRRNNDSFKTIQKRIEKLKNIIPQNTKILAFSSIMRISNNNINEEEKEYWNEYGKQIFDWSYKSHKLGYEIENKIPDEILKDYLKTRKRNFEINKLYLELAKEGFFDTLILSKDDCAEFGLNVKEAKALEYIIKRDNIKNAFIKTGADEIPLTLLARALNCALTVKPIFLENSSKNLISKYEDISIKDCVLGQLSLANIQISENGDVDLLINNFKKEQGDLVLGDIINNTDLLIDFPQKPYFVADVNNANGSDNKLIEQLFKQNPDNLYGYCGYNTSANTLGCAILSAAMKHRAIKNNSYNDLAFKKLQFIRLLDDWSYQTNNRKYVRENPPFDKALNKISDKLNKDSKKIAHFLNYYPQKIEYSLPWNRSFEIRIKLYN